MRKQQGELTVTGVDGTERYETITCGHCNCVVVMKPDADPATLGGYCQCCMKNTCNKPRCNASCRPFEKRLEAFERRAALRRAVTGSA